MPVLSALVLSRRSLVRVTTANPFSGGPPGDRDREPQQGGDQQRDVRDPHQDARRPVDRDEGNEGDEGGEQDDDRRPVCPPPEVPRRRDRRQAPVEGVERALELLQATGRPLRPKPLAARLPFVELGPSPFGERDEDDASECAPPAPGSPLGRHATAPPAGEGAAESALRAPRSRFAARRTPRAGRRASSGSGRSGTGGGAPPPARRSGGDPGRGGAAGRAASQFGRDQAVRRTPRWIVTARSW